VISPLLVALLGSATMVTFALGLWLPAYRRHRLVRRRLAGFVNAGTSAGFAVDLGGRRRSRGTRARSDDRGPWVVRQIGRAITQAQADVSAGEVIAAMAVLGLIALTLASILASSLLLGFVAGVVAATAPLFWLRWRRRQVEAKFAKQLIDTIALLSSSVRSGHSLLQALEHVVSEAPEPTRGAIGLVVREIGLGASQEDALERLGDRLPSDDLELVISAINIHHQIGGSLAKVLEAIAGTIRERVNVAGDIRSLTAQQRYSAYVLSLLPVAVAGVLFLVSPDYIGALFEPGPLRGALIAVAGMILGGFLVLQKMARIDV
jgi:tight adherence protein B